MNIYSNICLQRSAEEKEVKAAMEIQALKAEVNQLRVKNNDYLQKLYMPKKKKSQSSWM